MPKLTYFVENGEANTLSHYGRLGMKWGQHIFGDPYTRQSGRASKKFKKADKFGEKAKKANEKKYKYYSKISPKQLARGDTSGRNYKAAKEYELKETKYIATQHKLQVKGKKKVDKLIKKYGADYVKNASPELIKRGQESVALLVDRQLKDYTKR